MELTYRLICPECNEVRIATPSGACCPNGHGRLQVGVKPSQLREATRIKWAQSLDEAEPINESRRRYLINGKAYLSTSVCEGRYKVGMDDSPRDGKVFARDELGVPRCFKLSPNQTLAAREG